MDSTALRQTDIWKKKERKVENDDVFMMADISELSLTNRSINALRRAGCKTVGDLANLLGEDGGGLASIRNVGAKSRTEIIEKYELLREEYRNSTAKDGSGYFEARVMLTTGKKTWKREISHFLLSKASQDKFKESGIRTVSDLYLPTVKDPGWRAVRELFEAITNGRVAHPR